MTAKFYKKSCDELNDKIACSRIVDYYHWTHNDANKLKYTAKIVMGVEYRTARLLQNCIVIASIHIIFPLA
jgi:hypothetical protein